MSPNTSALRSAMRRMLRDRREIVHHDPHRDAGAAVFAGRPVGDRLAAAEAAMGQKIVEVAGALADEVGEHLAFFPAGKIGAGGRRGQIELRRVARMLGHVVRPSGSRFAL